MSNKTENNRLISEFMGWDIQNPTTIPTNLHLSNLELDNKEVMELQYHTSWNWLMPVAKKCIDVYHLEQMNDDLNFNFYDSIGNMDATYKAVLEFINQNSNTTQ